MLVTGNLRRKSVVVGDEGVVFPPPSKQRVENDGRTTLQHHETDRHTWGPVQLRDILNVAIYICHYIYIMALN